MTLNELKNEHESNTEREMIFEPIIENNCIIGVVQKFYCSSCEQWRIEQIFTANMNDELEFLVYEMGFREDE